MLTRTPGTTHVGAWPARTEPAPVFRAPVFACGPAHPCGRRTPQVRRRPADGAHTPTQDTGVPRAARTRSRQARRHFEDSSPVAPAVRNIDRTVEFVDLVTACHAFVARPAGPSGLCDRALSEDESTIVHQNVAKVRATLDWIETAVDTVKVDMDDELAAMLRGE
ncbi:DUF6192 family protein [Streptomyces anulatus]|uniref:DUF6192 family protein n=1 Tax=Streptomyces anulatus TaxID=1892 RepID=UPI003F4A06A8